MWIQSADIRIIFIRWNLPAAVNHILRKYYAKKQNKTKNAAHVAVMWTRPKNKRTTQTVNVSEQIQRKIRYDVDSITKLNKVSNNRHRMSTSFSTILVYGQSLHQHVASCSLERTSCYPKLIYHSAVRWNFVGCEKCTQWFTTELHGLCIQCPRGIKWLQCVSNGCI